MDTVNVSPPFVGPQMSNDARLVCSSLTPVADQPLAGSGTFLESFFRLRSLVAARLREFARGRLSRVRRAFSDSWPVTMGPFPGLRLMISPFRARSRSFSWLRDCEDVRR